MGDPSDKFTYGDITKAYRNEERSTDVSEIRRDFYPELRAYLEALKRESEAEVRTSPYSVKASSLTNEIKKGIQKSQGVFQLRMKKIAMMAVREALGGKVDTGKLTDEEMELFHSIVRSVSECRSTALEGELPLPKKAETVCSLVEEESRKVEEQLAPLQGREMPAVAPPAPMTKREEAAQTLVLIRVLEDLPPFSGGDRTYRLRKDDIANMPAAIGCALVKTGKAVELQSLQRA
jgi:DNA replication initiation complex subunit (GINS family)